MTCRVVCISRAAGAGGEEVGRLVAERLGFRYVDDEIVARAAARGGIAPDEVADEEQRKSLVARVLEALAMGSADLGGSPLGAGELHGDDVRALIRDTIEQTAAHGNTVIVAHAASYVVTPGPDVLRVLVTAPPHVRAARIGGAERLGQAEADSAVKESDAARRDYLKRFYDVDDELPTHYDLVVNTDMLSVEHAAELVLAAASR